MLVLILELVGAFVVGIWLGRWTTYRGDGRYYD